MSGKSDAATTTEDIKVSRLYLYINNIYRSILTFDPNHQAPSILQSSIQSYPNMKKIMCFPYIIYHHIYEIPKLD